MVSGWLAGRHQIRRWRGSAWLAAIMSIMSITKHLALDMGSEHTSRVVELVLVPLGALCCGAVVGVGL